MSTDIQKYRGNLFEIQKRTEVIKDHITGIRTTKYLITEVEFLCLQFRKILELIALSSLVANKNEYSKQHSKFQKHYNARLIFQDLERINPNFYPKPTIQIHKQKGDFKYIKWEPVKKGYLTKDEFLQMYEKCGGLMHAENPYSTKRNIQGLKNQFPIWLNKIITLLRHHIIELIDNKTIIVGLMHGQKDGHPYVYEFGSVEGQEEAELRKKILQ